MFRMNFARVATVLASLAALGCADPTDPSVVAHPTLLPRGPNRTALIQPASGVRYTDEGVMDITEAKITTVNGQPYAGGNTGAFPAGSSITVTGKYSVNSSFGQRTAYIAWITSASDVGGGLQKVLTNDVTGTVFPMTGSFTWNTRVPFSHGQHAIGGGMFLTFQFFNTRPGILGTSLDNPGDPTVGFASIVVESTGPSSVRRSPPQASWVRPVGTVVMSP